MTIRTEAADGVFTITIDRPEARNALSLAMGRDLCAAWEEFQDNPRFHDNAKTSKRALRAFAEKRRPRYQGK